MKFFLKFFGFLCSFVLIGCGLSIVGLGFFSLPFGLSLLPFLAGVGMASGGGALFGFLSVHSIHDWFERGSNKVSAAIVGLGVLGLLVGIIGCLSGIGTVIGIPLIAGSAFLMSAGITKYRYDTALSLPNNFQPPADFDDYSNQEKLEYVEEKKAYQQRALERKQQQERLKKSRSYSPSPSFATRQLNRDEVRESKVVMPARF